jgi:GNAT superfamily N-acetyltransferase
MARDFHDATPMRHLPFQERRAAQMFVAAVDSPEALVLILDVDGPKGALIMERAVYPLGNTVMAKEVIFWIDPRQRGRWWRAMIRAAEDWAKDIGAEYAAMSCFSDGRTAKVFERAGYEAVEVSTMKDLKWRCLPG